MKKLAIIFILFFVQNIYSQQANVYHVVASGETLVSIAQKYKVTPYDIVKLNPNAVDGVKEKEVLIIPKSLVVASANSTQKGTAVQQLSDKNQNVIVHLVQSRETKFGISKLYGITIQQLEAQNPQIVAGLQVGHKLQIEGSTTNYKQNLAQVSTPLVFDSKFDYTVLPGETLYGISKRNGLTVDQLVKSNASVLSGVLKSGQKLVIPTQKKVSNSSVSEGYLSVSKYHLVESGETKFGLSKKYGVTIEQLENLNPQIVKGLQTGQKLTLPTAYKETENVAETKPKVVKEAPEVKTVIESKSDDTKVKTISNHDYIDYEIQPKETLFGLSKKAGMTIKDFTDLNPKLIDAVQIGMVIKMPKNANVTAVVVSEKTKVDEQKKEINVPIKGTTRYKDLTLTLNKSVTKQLAFILPFSEAKYQEFLSTSADFKTVSDEFVKSNLEFYSGALRAIDSVKTLGVTFDIKLSEMQNDADNSTIESIVKSDAVTKSSAILIPFYDEKAQTIASDLSALNVPVLTNLLSKDEGHSNMYVSVPSEIEMRMHVLDYLKSKNANIIVVNSVSRTESKSSILEKFPEAKFVKVSDRNVVDTDDLKTLLVKDKLNYVILDSDKNSMIISSTNVLLNQYTEFQIQIVVLEPSLLLNYENVSSIRINILKMIYPSFSPAKKTSSKKITESSQNYLIGFDLTLDTLLRLSQNKDFETSAKEDVTEYLKFKFEYNKNKVGTNVNNGFYILQHDTDNQIKELN